MSRKQLNQVSIVKATAVITIDSWADGRAGRREADQERVLVFQI